MRLRFTGDVPLGRVEIDARIYLDPHSRFLVSTDFVLESMERSLRERENVRTGSRIYPVPSSRTNIEIFELSTSSGRVLRELGRLFIARRACALCHTWLPPTDLYFCHEHLGVAPELS